MNAQPQSTRPQPDVLAGPRFRPLAFLIWLLAAVGLGALAAWLAAGMQFYFAPLLLFPILVGTGLGAASVGLMRVAQMGNRPTAILGVLLAAVVAVTGQHYLDYRREAVQSLRSIEAKQPAISPDVARLLAAPPESFGDYLRRQADRGRPLSVRWTLRGWAAWLSWGVDGLLVIAAALAMVIPATRLPYCNACRSWYRTIRAGRTPPAAAAQLARLADPAAAIDAPARGVRYRLSSCQGGCGPTRLELFWETADRRSLMSLESWLDTSQRNAAMQTLDEGRIKDEG
jgi:hypothetical protein